MVLKVGPIDVDPPIVLAPMAGVTDQAYRRLCRSYGGALYVSEMVSARALMDGDSTTAAMLEFGDDEPVRSVQLFGVDPRVVGAAVRRAVEEAGADHVDLNFGCPTPKITRKGGGAALPVRRVVFAQIVSAAVRAAGAIPVTVKMRKGIDDSTLTYLEAGLAAEDAGAAAVTLHARTAEQLYSGTADWAAVAALKDAVTSIPVLGNGDVWVAGDALRMMAATGCDGVVVGRGCLGRPWLFRELGEAFAGLSVSPPPLLGEVVDVMRRHLAMLVELRKSETVGVRTFRKHMDWYLTGYLTGSAYRRTLMGASTVVELDRLFGTLDPSKPLVEGALGTPRGHTHGPRPVSLPEGWRQLADDPTPPPDVELFASGG